MRASFQGTGWRWGLGVLLLAAAVVGACGDNPMNPFFRITVSLSNPGSGSGSVTSVEPQIDIDCSLGPNGHCDEGFNDAGAGGSFSLDATPAEGSTFLQWLGCTSTSGTRCNLTFSAAADDTTFNVTAYFTNEAGPPGGLLRAR